MKISSLVVLALVGCTVAQSPERSELSAGVRLGAEGFADVGSETSAKLGVGVSAGDLDGDGMADILAGAPRSSHPMPFEGIVSVYTGSRTPTLSATLEVDRANSSFGVVSVVADVDGDGNADVLVGAPRYESTPALRDEGAVFLFLGLGGGALATVPAWSYTGGQRDARLGQSIVALGDLDLDGDDEFAVGAPQWDEPAAIDSGKVLSFDGGSTPILLAEASLAIAGALEGGSVAVAGNFLGDGQTIVASGAPGVGGAVGIYLANGLVYQTTLTTPGGMAFGAALAGGHDLDEDGLDDLVIGDPLADQVHIWSDANGDAIYAPGAAGSHTGDSVAIGDFEGDGYLDVLVGAPYADGAQINEGAVYELRNPGDLYGFSVDWTETGIAAGDRLGSAVAAGDVDGDGLDDAILGAMGHDGPLVDSGRFSVHFGMPASLGVDLGTAGDYAVLVKTGISTASMSDVTGNMGVSPAAATYITGFSLIMDPGGAFSTSTQVVGNVYAADYAVPTPSNLTTAISDMEIAFTDAASRPADVTELGAGDIGGMTLAPGVYQWGSGLLIPTDVTLEGSAFDVWIFQIAQDLTLSSGVQVILAGGALPENIFWQVSGLVDVGTTAHVEGIVLSQTGIVLATGATVDGRLLAQTAVTLDGATVVEPD